MSENITQMKGIPKTRHSKWNILSYNTIGFSQELVQSGFLSLYIFFYETETFLGIWYILAAQIIFALWNAINDPLLGYLTDRTFRFTKKLGKWMPWIIGTGIPMFLFYSLVYSPPNFGEFGLFIWLVVFLCIGDTFFSIFYVNYFGEYPEKFQLNEERVSNAQISAITRNIGVVISGVLPPLLFTFGNRGSYGFMGLVLAILGIVTMLLGIPGVKDDPELTKFYLESAEKRKEQMEERLSFFTSLKQSLTARNFIAYIIMYFVFIAMGSLAGTSLPYFVRYIMLESSDMIVIFQLGVILGVFVFIPIWTKIIKKKGLKPVTIISNIVCASALFMILPYGLYVIETGDALIVFLIILLFIFGIGNGGLHVVIWPLFADVSDELTLITKQRQSGVYLGIRTFFARFVFIFTTLIFAVIHTITNFNAELGAGNQPFSARIGIIGHFGLLPAILVIISTIIFWKVYDLSPEKKKQIDNELEKLGI